MTVRVRDSLALVWALEGCAEPAGIVGTERLADDDELAGLGLVG